MRRGKQTSSPPLACVSRKVDAPFAPLPLTSSQLHESALRKEGKEHKADVALETEVEDLKARNEGEEEKERIRKSDRENRLHQSPSDVHSHHRTSRLENQSECEDEDVPEREHVAVPERQKLVQRELRQPPVEAGRGGSFPSKVEAQGEPRGFRLLESRRRNRQPPRSQCSQVAGVWRLPEGPAESVECLLLRPISHHPLCPLPEPHRHLHVRQCSSHLGSRSPGSRTKSPSPSLRKRTENILPDPVNTQGTTIDDLKSFRHGGCRSEAGGILKGRGRIGLYRRVVQRGHRQSPPSLIEKETHRDLTTPLIHADTQTRRFSG
mmetsp:Transcript_17627/g.35770  ORF Transcript_17627/g.35770 Transcript_17627/m.35770 type:complete len:322 (-) Transcript_17627:571-1536(-)